MNKVTYFAFISDTLNSKGMLLNILMVDDEDVVLMWNSHAKHWQQTQMCKIDMLNQKHNKIIEMDVNRKYKFKYDELELRWNEIVLRNTLLGSQIL